jgi:hypothetical protein
MFIHLQPICAVYHEHAPTIDDAADGSDTVYVTPSFERANELCKWALRVAPFIVSGYYHFEWS